MNNLWTGLAVLLLSTALVACDGANSSSNKGKSGEADSHQDDGKNDGGDDSVDGKDDGDDKDDTSGGKDDGDGGGDTSGGKDDGKDDGGTDGDTSGGTDGGTDGSGTGGGGGGTDGSGTDGGTDGSGTDGGGGGTDGSGTDGGGDGGDGGDGGTTPTDRTNPLTKGKLPTERTAFYIGNTTGSDAVLTVDPKAGTFTYVFTPIEGSQDYWSDDGTIEGKYDPESGAVFAEKCTGSFSEQCDSLNSSNESGSLLGMPREVFIEGSGDDYTVLTNSYSERYYGVTPTDAEAMPSGGNVTYEGKFFGEYYYTFAQGGTEIEESLGGDAVTRVNFDTGKLEVDFSNFFYFMDTEMSGELRDVTIDGNRFSGGRGRVSQANGELMEYQDVERVDGRFFGPNGEELGGIFEIYGVGDEYVDEDDEYLDEDQDTVTFFGSWIGTAK